MCQNYFVHRTYHHGNLRAALIEAGVKLIEEKGAKALTLREIGERAGVSRTAAYRHFSDKADLLGAISEAGFAAFADALERAREGEDQGFWSRLDAMGIAYQRFAEKHRAYYEVMFGMSAGQSQAGDRAFGILEDTIRQGQAADEIRPGDSTFFSKVIWALSHGIAMLRLETDLSDQGAGTRFILATGAVLRTGLQGLKYESAA
jgi:AcrR family transcriptional regulator